MWYRVTTRTTMGVGLVALMALSGAQAAVIDVCATCTQTTLDDAIAVAAAGDTIVLDGPDLVTDPDEVYTLSTDLVIDDALDGLEIRGRSATRPDKIRIVGTGAGPVITVEEGFSFNLRGVTLTGGTTGVLAMADSNVDIRRCLIDGMTGVGVDCVEPEEVYMAATVVTNSGDDAVRIDAGGELNITQCTLLSNAGLGVNAIAGIANIVATLIHDCGSGLADGTGTALDVQGNWVTDAAGNPIPNAGGATDPYEFTDTLDPAAVFETTDNFPGEIDDAYSPFPRVGESAATLNLVDFFSRDFGNLGRDQNDLAIGADERIGVATAAGWTECYVIQRGIPRNWVNEGPFTFALVTPDFDLQNASVWIGNPTQSGIAVDNNTTPNRIGPLPVDTPSTVDTTFGFVDGTFVLEDFEAAFPNIPDPPGVNTSDYEIYIQLDGAPLLVSDDDFLDATDADGSQAEIGRVFGFDTIPPVVVSVNALADQYLDPPTDGDNPQLPQPPRWGDGLQPGGTVGANAGLINGAVGDPQVFFDGTLASLAPLVPNPLSFTVDLIFRDEGSGFATSGLPTGIVSTTAAEKDAILYREFANVPGFAWWNPNNESFIELIANDAAPEITTTYTVSNGNLDLETVWTFDNAVHDGVSQWHAIANVRVMDLAGNEATLDPTQASFDPLKPFHLWWFPAAAGQFRSGPAGAATANPVFTWGMFRLSNGQDPDDPEPCYPSVQYYVWRAVSAGVPGTAWADVSGDWSVWMDPTNRTITLDTPFSTTQTLRDIIAPFPEGSEYLIAIRGYDEAGNLQQIPGTLTGPAPRDLANVGAIAPLSFHRWTDPGIDQSLALDTRVQAQFWYNPGFGARDRTLSGGDQNFGAATRIPLPPAPPEGPCRRVEGGFNITMEIPDSVSPGDAFVGYELYEDGRLVASGNLSPTDAPAGEFDFVVPSDLMGVTPPAWVAPDDSSFDDRFLNEVLDCAPVPDRLGDDGPTGPESPFRQRDVKYQLLLGTGIQVEQPPGSGSFVNIYDQTPASVEFTVTAGRGLKGGDQPIKSFTRE